MWHYILAGDGGLIVERRATPRYDVELSVHIGVWVGGASMRGMTTNISESGMQVVIPTPIAEGTVVRFECPLFGGTVQVVWSRGEGSQTRLGLKFVTLAERDREALQELLTSLRKHQGPSPDLRKPVEGQEDDSSAAEGGLASVGQKAAGG
jgi:hypothetical protein